MKNTIITLVALAALLILHQWFVAAIESTRIYELQTKYLHWRYIHQAVFFLVAPLLAIVILRRKPSVYALRWNRYVLAAIAAIVGLTLIVPIAADLVAGQLRPVKAGAGYLLSTLIFQTLFSGCGEELFFRGMYQGEVDRVFSKRIRIGGTSLGPGVLVGALLFGLGHLGISSAMKGAPLNFEAFAITCLIGLFLGFVREFVGCIFIVGFLHASIDTYSYLVQPSAIGRIAHFMAIGVVCYLLFSRRIHAGKHIVEPPVSGYLQ